ncbi:MAG: tRNA 2-thiouridine(34) synthase MnmA [Paludibacteraceae bacterium]|nr:tRNA 2-thiouridine(34) synthase MnmA [Paludibacteraceae bacterium]
MDRQQTKILLALSGGVDSTAAALLLMEQGYQVVACTFKTRYTSEKNLQSAVDLARNLGIEHHLLDYDEVFDREIVSYFKEEYLAGRTPNPCVLCNKQIKFGQLLQEADKLGCAYIATGHYARIFRHEYLQRAKDEHKDQTYFLWRLDSDQIKRILFPLGDMTKPEVRNYLSSKGYATMAQQSESQDICFIKDDYRTFLQLPEQKGDYVDKSGKVVGHHIGYANYTIGQRKGLGIALGTPAFVTRIDAENNVVELGAHDDLNTKSVRLRDVVFRGDSAKPVMAQIRYRSKPTPAYYDNGTLLFDENVWAVTPGQSAVIYQDDLLVGGGIIEG